MSRVLAFALLFSASAVLSSCATDASLGVAELSPQCAQQYQQAGEHVQGGGEYASEQRGAAYTHYVSPNCKQEQERLQKSQQPAARER